MATTESPPKQQPKPQNIAFYTLGCKTNQLETATLADAFTGLGWEIVPFDEAADVYVINTCTVTERADKECRRIIRRAHLSNPKARIAVTGCYAQVAPEAVASLEGVGYVIGNQLKDELPAILESIPVSDTPYVQVTEIDKSRVMTGASRAGLNTDGSSRTRGSLKIQDGCDYKCTYCIIWEARGPSRSLPMADLKEALARMVDPLWGDHYKEVMLTGINIGQYQDGDADLSDLLNELISIPGDFRLRLTSLDPLEVTERLIDIIAASNGKICPHIHLSAQSADDYVLKRMGRRHHVKDMRAICDYIDKVLPDCQIGSDIIVGFPGESAARFQNTVEALTDCPMHYFHVFSYSKRPGTPAADFPDQIPEREKKDRAQLLRDLSARKNEDYRKRFLNRNLAVILEEDGFGTAENYLKIQVESDAPPNTKLAVKITDVDADNTIGVIA